MSPIRPENRDRYPDNWREISDRIRFERANGQCECTGECGMPAHLAEGGRCLNLHGMPGVYGKGATVVLTTAHLDHTPENCQDDNLRAMCQGCHLWYDREHHAETRAATLAAARNAVGAVELDLPSGDDLISPREGILLGVIEELRELETREGVDNRTLWRLRELQAFARWRTLDDDGRSVRDPQDRSGNRRDPYAAPFHLWYEAERTE